MTIRCWPRTMPTWAAAGTFGFPDLRLIRTSCSEAAKTETSSWLTATAWAATTTSRTTCSKRFIPVRCSSTIFFCTPVYWSGMVYFHSNGDVLRAFSWNANGTAGQQLSSNAVLTGNAVFGQHGATPSLSANGKTNGIIWEIDNSAYVNTNPSASGPAVLHAYDATNVANELYNSAQAASRDQAGLALKFTSPTIANGKVFVPTGSELDIYGLLGP